MKKRQRTGTFLGIPYDWRRPTKARVKNRLWNPSERRVLVPGAFGWGWRINLGRLFGRKAAR